MSVEELKLSIIQRLDSLSETALQEMLEHLKKLDEQKVIHLIKDNNLEDFISKNDSLLNRLSK